GDLANRHDYNVVPAHIRLLQHHLQVRHVVVVANRDEYATGAGADRVIVHLRLMLEIELLEAGLIVLDLPRLDSLIYGKQHEEEDCKREAADCRHLLREQVGYGHQEQHGGSEKKTDGQLRVSDPNV